MAKMEISPEAKIAPNTPSAPVLFRWSARFIAGIVLMTGSFLVYPAYPVIIIWLPISPGAKVTWSIAVWVLSWSAFSFGAFLAGPQGCAWFKGLWRRLTGRQRTARGGPSC